DGLNGLAEAAVVALATRRAATAATVFRRVKLYMTRPPLTSVGRSGGWRGSKSLRRINPANWLPRPDQIGIFDSFEPTASRVTCLPVFGPIIAGKFQFSGMCDSGRWTRQDHEEIEVYGGADCLHPAAGRGRDSGGWGLAAGGGQPGDPLPLARELRRVLFRRSG